ncbi:MAG: NFACT family protein [Candidatus Methylomirabilis oxyfera]|nr:NFACT family protein [Candidatus Methylomirabilis oxyfera]
MDALCLHAAIREVQPVLQGVKIGRVVQPDRWSLLLVFRRGAGPAALLLSVKPGSPRVEALSVVSDRAQVPSRFADLVGSRTKGALVETIDQVGLDRIVAVHLTRGSASGTAMTLYAEMRGPRGNLVLVDRSSAMVVARLRASSGRAGDPVLESGGLYRPELDQGRVDPRSVGEGEFHELVRPRVEAGNEPAGVLMTCFAGLGPLMARELVTRAELSLPAAPDGQARSLWGPFRELIGRVSDGLFEPRLLIGDDGQPIGLSAFRLATVPADRQVAYDTMSEAVAAYHEGREMGARREALRASVLRRLRGEIARAERLSAKLVDNAAIYEDADLHARKGQLLLANRALIRRGQRLIELPDYTTPTPGSLEIELDEARSAEENAKRYFTLHRKAKRGAEIVKGRLAEAKGRLTKLRSLTIEAGGAKRLGELQRIEAALVPLARRLPARERARSSASAAEGPEPRAFRSSDGLPILVGKSGPGNDRLTWRLARSHDLWLHAQGVPGSHVLVRLEKGKVPPPRTLREAAQIAAYYSRARGQVKAPVDYVLRKYLRKPKAAAPGVVLLSQEKTLVVRPDPDLVRRLHPASKTIRTEG